MAEKVMLKKMLAFLCCAVLSCSSVPKKEDYNCDECFIAMQCLYLMRDSKEKSICDKLIEACRDALKDRRKLK